jgi:SAM-dependent methyltransferase
VDIAAEPVAVMERRLELAGRDPATVHHASALELPFPGERFDRVYSIGCLHHTGDLHRAIAEVHRVLRPDGRASVMVYNAWSARRLAQAVRSRLARRRNDAEALRAMYDVGRSGEAAPHTEYVSPLEARRLFDGFGRVRISVENFDDLSLAGHVVNRKRFLTTAGRVLGLDLYIVADKRT